MIRQATVFRQKDIVDSEAGLCQHSAITRNDGRLTMKQKRPFKRCTVVCFNKDKIAALKKQLPSEKDLLESARRHKVLGHPARQAILHALSIDECCVCDIAEVLDKPVSTVSQHLRTLVSEGLLDYRQEGKLVFYSLPRNGGKETEQWTRREETTR